MDQKTILFFSCEPGGAEILIPVINLLKQHQEYDVVVLGYGYALERFKKKNISFIEVLPIVKNDFEIFYLYSPNYIITSAAGLPFKDMSEKYLWYNSNQMAVPTLAFLDQWSNYRLRFSGNTASEEMKYQPDYINCINDIAKKEMIQEGFNSNKLLTLGHPYLSCLKNEIRLLINTNNIKKKIGIPIHQEVILFVSEAIYEHYGNIRGYNQYEVFDLFLRLTAKSYSNQTILLKLHPKEEIDNYRYFQQKYKSFNIKILTNELSSLECIAISKKVYGMSSLMLIEAYILGKPVFTIQPDLVIEDPLVLSRYGYIPKISSFEDIPKDIFQNSNTQTFAFNFSESQFIKFMHDHL